MVCVVRDMWRVSGMWGSVVCGGKWDAESVICGGSCMGYLMCKVKEVIRKTYYSNINIT